jgi:uncharacterized protein with HEPN domain
MSRDEAYFLDVLLMAKDAREFTKGLHKEAFVSDRMKQCAVIRCLEVIGEAVKRLSGEAQAKLPQIPWTKMARMRDLLIHAYDRVDLDKVWDTVQNDLPGLISALEEIVPPEESVE